MADFKFLGDPKAFGGPIKKIRLHLQDGSVQEILPVDPATEVNVNDTFNVTCPRCTRHLRNDPRFEEI